MERDQFETAIANIRKARRGESYEEIIQQRTEIIEKMNIAQIEEYRKNLVEWLEVLESVLRNGVNHEGRKQYLIGLRNRVIIPLISEAKSRKKILNKIACGSAKSEVLNRFMKRAAEVLPLHVFQDIYGYAVKDLSEIEIYKNDEKPD